MSMSSNFHDAVSEHVNILTSGNRSWPCLVIAAEDGCYVAFHYDDAGLDRLADAIDRYRKDRELTRSVLGEAA